MEKLIEGYRRFRQTAWPKHEARFEVLASNGQSPRACVIACADSRVDPQMIFAAGPGELFVIRNVASLVPPYAPDADHHGTSAALEFAVRFLKVRHLVIMGHGQCGGVAALLRGPASEAHDDFIGQWMQIASQARERVIAKADPHSEEAHRMGELETVKVSLTNLMTFPWVRERVEQGKLLLHGCYFNIATGELERLGADGNFAPIV